MKALHAITLAAAMMISAPSLGQKPLKSLSQLRDGDLLFQTSSQSNAITSVTKGIANYAIDHVGIYHLHDGKPMVIEASYDGVREVAYEQFVSQSPLTLAGRVKGRTDIQATLSKAHSYIGNPYDYLYQADERAIYCSELVLLSYTDKKGNAIFQPTGMTFRDSSGQISPWWQDYYSRRMHEVPEGQPGSNPGELSRRENLKIKYIIQILE